MFDWIVWLILAIAVPAQPVSNYESLRQRAEASYADKSFAEAHRVYEEASKLTVPGAERRWIDFRLADTQWRSRDQYDSEAQAAVAKLTKMVQEEEGEHDRVWAEANESIGDSHTLLYGSRGTNSEYIAAADWWANSPDIPLARQRYLQLAFKIVAPTRWENGREQFPLLPRNMLLDALRIATSTEDIAHLRYLLAMQLLAERRPESIERGLELLDRIIAEKKSTSWYDDALMAYADQLANYGDVVMVEGEPATKHDYAKALDLYRRITTEFKQSETRYYTQAQVAIHQITDPSLGLTTPANFLPDSEQQVMMSWRNVHSMELSIAKIDLTDDIAPPSNPSSDLASMLRNVPLKPLRRWTYEPADNGLFAPGNDLIRITPRLEPGAYVIFAAGGRETSRVVVLVTDINIVMHHNGSRRDVYVSDVLRGAPVAGTRLRMWQDGQSADATTDANGLARFDLRDDTSNSNRNLLITASAGAKQAYLSTYSGWTPPRDAAEVWRIYAFTDRPAYRPGETVHWKIIARTRTGNEPWHTPAHRTINYEIQSPRGEKPSAGTAELNEFGGFWTDLPLTPDMALGEYRIQFMTSDSQHRSVGSAGLFALEEYKLPEFTVTVTTPQKYRLGDTVEAVVEARYYFGGPVADATVEVTVDQSPYYAWTNWYAEDWYWQQSPAPYRGGGQNLIKQTLRTDPNGRAIVHFDTPRDGNDTRYTISAQVTDASRREVWSETDVVVMKQSYRVAARPQHSIGTPGEKISVDFKATDSREQGVKTTGKVHVVRKQWELVKQRGEYHDTDVLTTTVSTNDKGEGTFTFTPDRDGYYVVSWSSEDRRGDQPLRARDIVKTETSLWVSRNATTDLGYHAGGLELVLDRDVLHPGDRAPLIVMTENSGRWVLLTISAAEIVSTQVVHLDGTAKLIELPIDEQLVPDFTITATSVFDRTLRTQSKAVKVPPVDRALTVEVKSDRDEYKPRQSGTLTVTTRDYLGHPVSAEVALALSDESVTAIAQDQAGDPRQYFYGESRLRTVNVVAGVQMQRFVRLVVGPDGRLIDESQLAQYRDERERKDSGLMLVDGATLNENLKGARPQAVAEAITVTASAPAMLTTTALASVITKSGNEEQPIEVVVRSDFRSTAFWKPDVITDANGIATVKVDYPEALTEWRATARAATTDSRFGMATSKSHTNLPLIVRLQAPRFFVAGDRSTVSAVINNNTDQPMHVTPSLEATGVVVTSDAAKAVDVPPHGEARADWTIAADTQGTATLRVSGRSATDGDGMEKSFTVYEHGIDKLVAQSGKVRGSEALIRLDLPNARRDTALVVNVSPSLAAAMTGALPYLVEYPYGCTEQTMSRFLPASIVARTLAREHLPQPAWMSKLDDVTKKSLARLYDFQHADGGWGWWKEDDSQSFMTAYVIWGLSVAREGGIDVDRHAAERGVQWLDDHLVTAEHDPNAQAWMLHALAAWRHIDGSHASDAEQRAFDNAYAKREQLSSYSRALLALAAHDFGDTMRAQVLVRNLENGVKIDRSPDRSALIGNQDKPSPAETMATAHWGSDRFWWHWYDGPVETTAFALQALVTIDPQNKLIEPVMNWMVKNRRGSRWNNTRDTAIAILALDDYLRTSEENSGDIAYEVSVNGRVIGTKSEAASFTVDPELVRDANQIAIRRTRGRGPLYFSVEGRFVSLEEPVTPAGHELFVRRDYLRLVPKPTLLKGVVYDEVPLREGESLASGERVVVVVTIETKNDYEYLLFEDLKPAGLEAVSLNSSSTSAENKEGGSAYVYQELRDRKVALFANELKQGTWTIQYQLRAETPGEFHALPVLGEAMYVPEVRANGAETHITVTEH